MELHERPVEHVENKFMITVDRAYFLPCLDKAEAPQLIEILGEVFDLEDPEISHELEEKLSEGRIVLGYYDPSAEEIEIHLPLEANEFVEKRLEEVFDV